MIKHCYVGTNMIKPWRCGYFILRKDRNHVSVVQLNTVNICILNQTTIIVSTPVCYKDFTIHSRSYTCT